MSDQTQDCPECARRAADTDRCDWCRAGVPRPECPTCRESGPEGQTLLFATMDSRGSRWRAVRQARRQARDTAPGGCRQHQPPRRRAKMDISYTAGLLGGERGSRCPVVSHRGSSGSPWEDPRKPRDSKRNRGSGKLQTTLPRERGTRQDAGGCRWLTKPTVAWRRRYQVGGGCRKHDARPGAGSGTTPARRR